MNDQEKRELMIKAAVKFEGKWPDVAEEQDCLIVSKQCGEIRASMIDSKNIHEDLDKLRFDIVCTRAEFEAFMQELAGNAPEWATHYLPSNKYYYVRRNHAYCLVHEYGVQNHAQLDGSAFDSLIPLPKREPSAWLPEVGNLCEYTTTEYQESKPSIKVGEWYRAKVIAYHDDFVWTSDNGLRMLSITKFRPVRTEAEIARQALYDSLCELDADLDDYQINCLIEFIQGRDND